MSEYDVAVVGGGPAGLTTALYTTRLGHTTIVLNRGGGRCAMMADTHNVLGVSEETSGNELLRTGKEQIQYYGADYEQKTVIDIEQKNKNFAITAAGRDEPVTASRVVLATGFNDEHPPAPAPRTARGLHYCLHCDAYMFVDKPVYVMGHNDSAAHVAMIMLNFTDDVDLLLRGHDPEWSDDTQKQVEAHPITVIEDEVTGVNNGDDGWLDSLEFADGTTREYTGGFAMYGSNYNNGLAEQLDCEVNDDGTIAVDDHGRTSTDGVYAVGDVTDGHNQIPVRMGQGAKAGIALHYDLRKYPVQTDELDSEEMDPPIIDDDLRKHAQEDNNH